ncbi:MAG TPA: hypothetical protein VFP87_07655 [Chitinophagaceae bacterium]|nr:hypothetical protein [Chitinophagaceae bacterium]
MAVVLVKILAPNTIVLLLHFISAQDEYSRFEKLSRFLYAVADELASHLTFSLK